MPTAKQTDYAAQYASQIVKSAKDSSMWHRMNTEGRLVECRSILCTMMLKDRHETPQSTWLSVYSSVQAIVESEE